MRAFIDIRHGCCVCLLFVISYRLLFLVSCEYALWVRGVVFGSKQCFLYWLQVINTCVVVKISFIGTRTRNFHSRVRHFAGLSIPGRDIDFMSCSVFICAMRSLYRALNSIPLHMDQNVELRLVFSEHSTSIQGRSYHRPIGIAPY